MRTINLFIAALLPAFLTASSWYDAKLEGWYYFEEKKADEKPEIATPQEAEEFIAQEAQTLKQFLSLALVVPSPENVANYIGAQRRWIQQSNSFAQTWAKVLLHSPNLGDFLNTPTSSYGILAKRTHDVERKKTLLETLSRDHFLLFFFKGQDPLAAHALEAVQLFCSLNGWKHKAVSLDGKTLPGLDELELDKGISKSFDVEISPALFMVNPSTNQTYPVGAGLVSVSEIEENIALQMGGEQ